LKTSDYLLSLDALARLLCPVRFQYLMLFLAFVRAAHYWTETHPEIAFRPVQECLTNIHRHSGSKTALIRLEREGDRVHVKVEDQGNGMSPERLAEVQSHATGVGITGMRERIRHLRRFGCRIQWFWYESLRDFSIEAAPVKRPEQNAARGSVKPAAATT
jgi:signal transduction histidine kinase